jgi:hypothetical protein
MLTALPTTGPLLPALCRQVEHRSIATGFNRRPPACWKSRRGHGTLTLLDSNGAIDLRRERANLKHL